MQLSNKTDDLDSQPWSSATCASLIMPAKATQKITEITIPIRCHPPKRIFNYPYTRISMFLSSISSAMLLFEPAALPFDRSGKVTLAAHQSKRTTSDKATTSDPLEELSLRSRTTASRPASPDPVSPRRVDGTVWMPRPPEGWLGRHDERLQRTVISIAVETIVLQGTHSLVG